MREAPDVGASDPVRVVVDIRRTEDTISGELAVRGAPASSFFGWLELIDLLRRAAEADGVVAEVKGDLGDGSL